MTTPAPAVAAITDSKDDGRERVQTALRFRPLSVREKDRKEECVLVFDKTKRSQLQIRDPSDSSAELRTFTADFVFDS